MLTEFAVTMQVNVEAEDMPSSHSNMSTFETNMAINNEKRSRISNETAERSGNLSKLDDIDHDSDGSPSICSLDCDVSECDSDLNLSELKLLQIMITLAVTVIEIYLNQALLQIMMYQEVTVIQILIMLRVSRTFQLTVCLC